jgi:hypothetical protein
MSGPELQANAIATMLGGLPLRTAPLFVPMAAIVILGMAIPVAGARLRLLATLVASPLLGRCGPAPPGCCRS